MYSVTKTLKAILGCQMRNHLIRGLQFENTFCWQDMKV